MQIARTKPEKAFTAECPLPVPQLLSRALQQAWDKGLLSEPSLEPDSIIEHAMRGESAALDKDDWWEGFTLLAEELRGSARLNPLGRAIAHGQLVKILRQRGAAGDLWARHPEIDVPIRQPIIILGHMRSGTTRLHRMLACDRRFCATRLYETLAPVAQSSAKAIASATLVQTFLKLCNPRLGQIHPTSPLAAEEEFGLHAFSFHGAMFEAQWNVPRFARWCERHDLRATYADFYKLVQTARWKRGDGSTRPQLLKAPQFMQELDDVLRVFPDARILWVRREFREVVPSTASLVWNQQRVQSDHADPMRIGREWLQKTRLRELRAYEVLRRHPKTPVLKLDYSAMSLDWRSEMRRVYDFLNLDFLQAEVTDAMARIATASSHIGHSYTLEQFGLSETELRCFS